jgi:hypothetical protein
MAEAQGVADAPLGFGQHLGENGATIRCRCQPGDVAGREGRPGISAKSEQPVLQFPHAMPQIPADRVTDRKPLGATISGAS